MVQGDGNNRNKEIGRTHAFLAPKTKCLHDNLRLIKLIIRAALLRYRGDGNNMVFKIAGFYHRKIPNIVYDKDLDVWSDKHMPPL